MWRWAHAALAPPAARPEVEAGTSTGGPGLREPAFAPFVVHCKSFVVHRAVAPGTTACGKSGPSYVEVHDDRAGSRCGHRRCS